MGGLFGWIAFLGNNASATVLSGWRIEFVPVSGYISPLDRFIAAHSGESTNVHGSYQAFGALQAMPGLNAVIWKASFLPFSPAPAILCRMMTLIVGTNRPDSNTRKVAAHVEEIYNALGAPLHVLDLARLPPEIFSPTSYGEKPKAFQPFAEAILKSSGLVVVTPEYNGGIPGVLKYFIDMLKFPESFEKRPVCFVGVAAGIWGALRPVEQLQAIFGYRNAFVYPERVFLPKIGDLLNEKGRLTNAEILDRLKAQAEGFVDFVERVKGVKLRAPK